RYDSSIFPVRHDRYGIVEAPRAPFLAEGQFASLLELPLATWRGVGENLPVGGGGSFPLFPPALPGAGLNLIARHHPAVAMLYFHPWEFDAEQTRLPLGRLARWRTYVGIGKSQVRLKRLIMQHAGRFHRAIDVVADLELRRGTLPRFRVMETPLPA